MVIEKKYFDFKHDYATLQMWWKAHGSYAPKPRHLSQTGLIIYIDDIPVCAGFLYQTDSAICIFEFVVSDPNASKEIRDSGVSRLILEAKNWAAEHKYDLIYTSVKSQKYIKRLLESGFILADEGQCHLFYEV